MKHTCPICAKKFKAYPDMRPGSNLDYMCKPCQDEFDEIDWEEVYNRRMDAE